MVGGASSWPGPERAVWRLGPECGAVSEVAFDPTGRYLATANGNGTVYIFRLPEEFRPRAAAGDATPRLSDAEPMRVEP